MQDLAKDGRHDSYFAQTQSFMTKIVVENVTAMHA